MCTVIILKNAQLRITLTHKIDLYFRYMSQIVVILTYIRKYESN